MFRVFACQLCCPRQCLVLRRNNPLSAVVVLCKEVGRMDAARASFVPSMFPTDCLLFFLAAADSSRSSVLPGPAPISAILTQSLDSLWLMLAKPSPPGLLLAGPKTRLISKGKVFARKFCLPFSGWSLVHPLQLTAFPAYQPGGWLGKHFKQAGVSHAQALSSKFPLTAFQKRAPNPSGLAAAASHLAAGGDRLAGLVTDGCSHSNWRLSSRFHQLHIPT